MNQLSVLSQAIKTMSSREIAELVEKRHDKVKRTVSDRVERIEALDKIFSEVTS